MQDRRRVEHADPSRRDVSDPLPSKPSSDRPPGTKGWLAAPVVAIVAVLCCAGPLLVAALVASGSGVWLSAHGYSLGAATLIVLAVIVALRIRTRMSNG